jgi:hypothetical protein
MTKRPKRIRRTKANIRKALDDLQINVPYYHCRVVGNRLEFHLYGGQVRYWPELASDAKQPAASEARQSETASPVPSQAKGAAKRPPNKQSDHAEAQS